MSTDHYVIIGNGPAGNKAASTLRQNNSDARITILSDECLPYYFKPKLTGYIAGNVKKADLVVPNTTSYEEQNIRIRLGQAVEKIDVDNKLIYLHHMETINYTKLIIASGSYQRVLPSMADYSQHLKFITSYSDVMECKDAIQEATDFFIFGGDFVGFNFVRMLKEMDKNVIVLIYPNAFWPYNLNDEMENIIRKNLLKLDVTTLIKDDIKTIDPDAGRYKVTTTKGFEIDVDMVFSFNGLVPNIGFVEGSGIDHDHGILVDEHLRSNVEDIYACGSCAQIYNPDIKSYSVSIGWPNAKVQGEVAALNALGGSKEVESVGRKYFDMEGVKIKTTWWEDISG